MPALPPLSMVPGGLIQNGGAPVSVPAIGMLEPMGTGTIVQTTTGSTNVSGPASFTLTFGAASKVGTYLVVHVAVNASAAAALGPTPPGWTLLWSQVTATLALGCYVYPNNPGGITAFTLSGPTATTGGIAGVQYEFTNCPFPSDVNLANQGSSTTPNSGGGGSTQLVPPGTNNVIYGAIAWVLGTATLTFNNNAAQGGSFTSVAQVSSTNGTTNAAIQTAYIFQPANVATASFGFRLAGTLTVSSVWCAGIANVRSTATDLSVGSQVVDQPAGVIAGGQQAISVGSL